MNTLTKTGSIIGKAALAAMLAGCLSVPGLAGADVGDGNSGSSGAVAGDVSGNSGSTSGGSTGTSTTTPKMKTLAGDDATDTAAAIAKEAFAGDTSVDAVVICNVNSWQDAMAATGLAGAVNAPILLVNGTEPVFTQDADGDWVASKTDEDWACDTAAVSAIDALNANSNITKAYIVGGEGAVNADVKYMLEQKYSSIKFERIAGSTAAETSLKCANEIAKVDKEKNYANKGKYAIVANSANFADAVSMSSFAYKYHAPIFITTEGDNNARSLDDNSLTSLTSGDYANADVFVLGGQGALSSANIEDNINEWSDAGRIITRIYGDDGYDTSNQVANYLTSKGLLGTDTVTVACGATSTGGSDALAGAALAGKQNSVVLLTNANSNIENVSLQTVKGTDSEGVEAFVANNNKTLEQYYVLGGSYVCPVNELKGNLISGHVHNYVDGESTSTTKHIEDWQTVCVSKAETVQPFYADVCADCGEIFTGQGIYNHFDEISQLDTERDNYLYETYCKPAGLPYSDFNSKTGELYSWPIENEDNFKKYKEYSNYHDCLSCSGHWYNNIISIYTDIIITPSKYETVDKGYDEVTTTTVHKCAECGDAYTTSSTEQTHNS